MWKNWWHQAIAEEKNLLHIVQAVEYQEEVWREVHPEKDFVLNLHKLAYAIENMPITGD